MSILIATVSAILLLAGLILYPWIIVAVLLFVPVAKGAAEYYIPLFQSIDLTLATCLLAGVVALWNLVRAPRHGAPLALPWKAAACLMLLAFLLAVGLAWTSAPDYGFRKAARFAGIGIPFLLLPAFLIRSRREALRVIRIVIITGAVTALAVLFLPDTYFAQESYGRGYARGTVWGSSPIIPASLSATAIICVITGFVVGGGASKWFRYSALIVLPVGLFAILKTGTRSSFFALVATAVLIPLFVGRGGRGKAAFVILIAIPLAAFAGFLMIESSVGPRLTRWEDLTAADRTEMLVEGRSQHYMYVLQNWWRRPILGRGSGSFAVDAFDQDVPAWPHNIILEALYETGIVGTVALLGFFWVTIRAGRRGLKFAATPTDRFLVLASFVTFLLFLMESMAHWDIDGARFLYLFAGIVHAVVAQVAFQPAVGYVPSPTIAYASQRGRTPTPGQKTWGLQS